MGEVMLSDMESAVLRAAAEGMPIAMIADIENSTFDEVADACIRAMSIIRHPSTPLTGFHAEDISAAERLACSPLPWRHRPAKSTASSADR